MPSPSLNILASPHKLASPISLTPKFSVPLKDSEGRLFQLADPRATRALIACMDMEAAIRGAASHWGGPSAFAEIMSALYALLFFRAKQESQNWFELFHLINDAGHCENGLYALKTNYTMAGLSIKDLKHFRSLKSKLTGHGEAHLFPEGVYLSNGPLGSTLAQAQGLAMADKLLGHNRITISTLSDGAFMEGEAKEALCSIPGFRAKKQINPFLLIISDNNTKLSGRIDKDSFSLEPSLKSLSEMGWDCSFISKGNELKTVFHSLQEALNKLTRESKRPLALIFKTCKGFGVKQTMEDPSGGHGFPLKTPEKLKDFVQEIYGSENPPSEILDWCKEIQKSFLIEKKKAPKVKIPKEKTQAGISKALIEQKQKGLPLVSISSDLYGSTGLAPFRKHFPQYSFDVGVAEANMISVAAGFSKQGFIPIVDTFAQFAVTKGSLPLLMSALSQAPLMGVFSHAGFQDAADGASHQALSYFAKTCSLPWTEVYALSCSEEAYHLMSQAVESFYQEKKAGRTPKSKIFFLGRETFPKSFGASSYALNKAQVLFQAEQKDSPVLIVSCGPLIEEAFSAVQKISDKARGVVLINSPCVSDPDIKSISKWLKICEGRLLCVEDHQVKGGFSSLLLLKLKEAGQSISKFQSLAVRGELGRSAYKSKDLYQMFKMDSVSIQKAVLNFDS